MSPIVLIIALITFIFVMGKWCTPNYYEKMGGDQISEVTENFIEASEHKSRDPLDNYRLGSVFDYYYGDAAAANIYYNEALDQLIAEPEAKHTNFIVDRVRDRFETPKIETLTRAKISKNVAIIKNKKPSPPAEVKQQLDNKIQWTRDNQNVHDSNLSGDVKSSYDKIVRYNKGKTLLPFAAVADYMAKHHPKALEILQYIPTDSTISKLNPANPIKEYKVISHIWTRINSRENKKNNKELIESFASSLIDCKENGIVVCAGGRVSRMMQSLAHLDNDPKIGELKSKESIRNELFSNTGQFVSKEYKKMSEADQDNYINDKETPGTKKYRAAIEKFVQKSVKIYKLPAGESALLVSECLAAI